MESYTTVKERSEFRYEDRKSVFIGECAPVSCEEDALAFLESVKKRFPDARHHVYAYVLRDNSIMRFSDDREPQGTAGMPVLDVIRKNCCTDTVIVVTRYFGGTLLGTGGLVRAYTAAALGALNDAQVIVYDVYRRYRLVATYSDYQKLNPVFSEYGFRLEDSRFTDKVELQGTVTKAVSGEFVDKLTQLTSGRINIEFIDEKFDF